MASKISPIPIRTPQPLRLRLEAIAKGRGMSRHAALLQAVEEWVKAEEGIQIQPIPPSPHVGRTRVMTLGQFDAEYGPLEVKHERTDDGIKTTISAPIRKRSWSL